MSLQGKMLDLMFVIDDAESWHNENIARNPLHYSFLRQTGSKTIAKLQRAGGGVYYNTLVKVQSKVCFCNRFVFDVCYHTVCKYWPQIYTCKPLNK